jgi:protein-L-isoaspartate(D-aspartate) O-methyltransferase
MIFNKRKRGPQCEAEYENARRTMVTDHLKRRNIVDERVLTLMARVPRHEFVPEALLGSAYDDRALPLSPGKTISQPYIVALMLQALKLEGGERVLEIGTGSGYETALLSQLAREIFSMELDEALLGKTKARLHAMGCLNVVYRAGNGFRGWAERAPFDRIVITAAPGSIPRELVRQLAPGGRMVLPLGTDYQELICLEKAAGGLVSTELGGVRFVPMIEE